jgi:hypothetical protein
MTMRFEIVLWTLDRGFTLDLADKRGELIYATPLCPKLSDAAADLATFLALLETTTAAFGAGQEVA